MFKSTSKKKPFQELLKSYNNLLDLDCSTTHPSVMEDVVKLKELRLKELKQFMYLSCDREKIDNLPRGMLVYIVPRENPITTKIEFMAAKLVCLKLCKIYGIHKLPSGWFSWHWDNWPLTGQSLITHKLVVYEY